ncbi:Fc.00g061940.m01.CDS01 [Cosmosporella sp. VM-42]
MTIFAHPLPFTSFNFLGPLLVTTLVLVIFYLTMLSDLYSLIRLHILRIHNHGSSTRPSTSTAPESLKKDSDAGAKIFRPAIATMSLGKPGVHCLDMKLRAASEKGFQGVELYWDDLEAFAKVAAVTSSEELSTVDMLYAARKIRKLCTEINLEIISLQPFRDYDGITDLVLHARCIREFQTWLFVAQELGTRIIGVPPTINATAETHTGEKAVIVADLVELAALAKPYGIQIAYENLCFGAHVKSWKLAWDIVRRARKQGEEIGFLPDTFNICGDVFADPTSLGGQTPNAVKALKASLKALTATILPSSIPFIQIADAERLTAPLSPDHPWMQGCTSAKMAWSRNARLFPMEEGGYLPMVDVIEAVVQTGWSGWVSQEVFTRATATEGQDTVRELAGRAWRGWEILAERMGWEARP